MRASGVGSPPPPWPARARAKLDTSGNGECVDACVCVYLCVGLEAAGLCVGVSRRSGLRNAS